MNKRLLTAISLASKNRDSHLVRARVGVCHFVTSATKTRLVDERGGLQGVIRAAAPQVALGQHVEHLVNVGVSSSSAALLPWLHSTSNCVTGEDPSITRILTQPALTKYCAFLLPARFRTRE
jgi:hypothetical protein